MVGWFFHDVFYLNASRNDMDYNISRLDFAVRHHYLLAVVGVITNNSNCLSNQHLLCAPIWLSLRIFFLPVRTTSLVSFLPISAHGRGASSWPFALLLFVGLCPCRRSPRRTNNKGAQNQDWFWFLSVKADGRLIWLQAMSIPVAAESCVLKHGFVYLLALYRSGLAA
jgi:hypothetical protein